MDTDLVRRYARIRYTCAIGGIVLFIAVLVIFQLSGACVILLKTVNRFISNPRKVVFVYSTLLFFAYTVFTLPLTYYRSFVVEHRFGQSTENGLSWFTDFLKGAALEFLSFAILINFAYYCISVYPAFWWCMLALGWSIFGVIIARIFPVLILPLFFKSVPVADEVLRSRILRLSKSMNVNILDVYEIDFSKKTKKANAAVVGMGSAKRVILTDTLKEHFSADEIEGILAHEFMHFKLKHILKRLIINSAVLFSSLFVIDLFARYTGDATIAPLADISNIAVWFVFFTFIQLCLAFPLNYMFRRTETNCDLGALKFTGNKSACISMLKKLGEQNLSDPNPPLFIKWLFFDHPPIEERVARLEREKI